MTRIGVEVGAHAILEINRLTDVNNRPFFVVVDVATGLGWEGGKNTLNFFRNFHWCNFTSSVTFALQLCFAYCAGL